MIRRSGLLFVAAVALLAACTSNKGTKVTVIATDTACQPATTAFTAGKVTFSVQNKGKDVTELYVLQGTKTVGEVENVSPGTSRTISVTLKPGIYDLNCKPGMKGDGIRTPITVTGSGGSAEAAATTEVKVTAKDFTFDGVAGLQAKKGDTVDFDLSNAGPTKHELEIVGPDGKSVGEVAPIDGGQTGSTTVTFKKAGTYTYRCDFANHSALGMKGTFTVRT
jgi:plastocyanin